MRRSLVFAPALLAACALPHYENRIEPLIGSPAMSSTQAEAICAGEAQLAGQQARSAAAADIAVRNAATSTTMMNCTSNSYGSGGYRTTNTDCTPQTVNNAYGGRYGALAAVGDAMAPDAAYREAWLAAGNSCLARYGWTMTRRCVANCR